MEAYSILLTRRYASDAHPQVFLIPDSDSWQLPAFLPERDIYNTDVNAANTYALARLGVPVVTRYALRLVEPALGCPQNIYVMERRHENDNSNLHLAGSWFGRDRFQDLLLALPKSQAVVAAWFAEAHGDNVSTLPIPWWQEGWFEAASARLQTQVTQLGMTILAPVEQIRSSYTSAILRVLTDKGNLYLKLIPAALTQEIVLTQMLAQRDYAHNPVVLSTDRDCMLLGDLGDHQPLGSNISLARWEEIVRFYGQFQVSSVDSIPQWFSAGCADLRTDRLVAQMEALLAGVPERLKGLPQQLSSEEFTRLRSLAGSLRALCLKLASYGVPDALEHGDLHAGNVAILETGFSLYDWSHACITHPFYGFGSLFLDDDWFPEQPEAIPRLRDAYLETWTQYAPISRLQAAFALWKQLRPLFLAAHQSYIVGAYQEMLGGDSYIPETATGNALQYMQWWLLCHWRDLLQSLGTL